MIYFNSGLGDQSLSSFIIHGSRVGIKNSLNTQGTKQAFLYYSNCMAVKPALSYQAQSNSAPVNIFLDRIFRTSFSANYTSSNLPLVIFPFTSLLSTL